ncbi:GTPase SAR1 family protein [Flavobacterium gossypii]|uniref:GTPase SAR1 family protein n=1 Tax=Flavobacterium gossypii TaxID=1646119 RepID=A0ABR6DLC1_9FLAO|nr:NACHT domain-containing protein [Flavobacterium gossypii]MBA9072274.1 GTPase SAR1 family protein [Flavobacterium gossypii]
MQINLKSSQYTSKVEFKEIVRNLFDFNLGSVLTDIITIDNTKEMKAFLLIFKTIKKTNFDLSKELGQLELNKSSDLLSITQGIETELIELLEKEIKITKEFFEDVINYNPEYLTKTFLVFKKYLNVLGIKIEDDLNYKYYKSFRNNLEIEYQENKEIYKELVDFFDNPIFKQNIQLDKQLDYYKNLIKLFTNPLQPKLPENLETLKDLYIEPYFKFHKNNIHKQTSYKDFHEPLDNTLSLHKFVNEFFLKGVTYPDCKETYNLIFLLGQPGQGKTSFCYKLIYDYLESSIGLPSSPLYFIKIRELVARDFIDNPLQTVNSFIGQNIDFREDKCVLILDGLDEAYMSGGLNDNDLRVLYERLNKVSFQNKKLKIILTSRLNYLNVNDSCFDNSLVIQLEVLSDNQIKEYSERFKTFYPNNKLVEKIDSILTDYNYEHIKELLQQAVLIYFIAMSNIDIDKDDSRSIIYDKIFSSLAKRSWEENGQLSYLKSDVRTNPKKYERYLREYIRNIAFEIYQSPNLHISVDKLRKLDATKIFIKKCFDDSIEITPDKINEISKYLLISFYFQESKNNQSSETAIEFFHNSLWEYLTAEYMWEENKKMLLQKDSDGDIITKTADEYFEFINKIIGQKKLVFTIKNNLEDIIYRENNVVKQEIFNNSKEIFFSLLHNDFLLEYSSRNNSLTSFEKSVSIFELFWTFFYNSNDSRLYIYTNTKLNSYLLSFSYNYYADYQFNDIVFGYDFPLSRTFSDCEFNNVHFNFNYIEDLSFINCNINGGSISCIFDNSQLIRNKFSNVIFRECIIDFKAFFEKNEFIDCIFLDLHIPDKLWLDNFFKDNNMDEIILANHKVVKRRETYGGKYVYRYFFDYKGSADLLKKRIPKEWYHKKV